MQTGVITVVAFDDHPLIRAGIERQLEKTSDIRLIGEGDCGDDVLRLAGQLQPNVVLLDIEMPQSTGSKQKDFKLMPVIPVLRQRFPDMAIIIISQYLSQSLLEGTLARGVMGYLLKDDILTLEVATAIRQVVAGRHYLSRGVTTRLVMNPYGQGELTERQREILMLLVEHPNLSYAEFSALLNISEGTFKNHISELKRRFHANTLLACVIEAIQEGIVHLPQ